MKCIGINLCLQAEEVIKCAHEFHDSTNFVFVDTVCFDIVRDV